MELEILLEEMTQLKSDGKYILKAMRRRPISVSDDELAEMVSLVKIMEDSLLRIQTALNVKDVFQRTARDVRNRLQILDARFR